MTAANRGNTEREREREREKERRQGRTGANLLANCLPKTDIERRISSSVVSLLRCGEAQSYNAW